MQIQIYYEDTDAGGIVYHSKYINFCERARSQIFFDKGMIPGEDEKSGFVVKHIEADFIRSSRLCYLLEVKTHIEETRRTSLSLRQEIFKEETLLFSMHAQLVYMKEGRISRIPEHFLILFETLSA
jgi:acyl-CoA thioester hydrolase